MVDVSVPDSVPCLIIVKVSSLSVMRGLASKNYVDQNKVEGELLPALSYNYSRNLDPIWLEMKKGVFC
jgi:hypothetical protein